MLNVDETLIWIEECDPPYVSLTFSSYSWQNATLVKRRAQHLAAKYSKGWHCLYCRDLMSVWKRRDATYCCESCRKMAARARRNAS